MSVICHFIKAHINAEIFQITKAVTALGALGAKQKVILLECDVFLSYIFVEWTYSGLDCIQAVGCVLVTSVMLWTVTGPPPYTDDRNML